MKAMLVRANKHNYDLGDRNPKYVLNNGKICESIENIDRIFVGYAFCEIDIEIEDVPKLVDEFGYPIIFERPDKKDKVIHREKFDIVATIYDAYIE